MFYSHMGDPTLPSTLFRFTSLFGMESGGSKTLWSQSKFFSLFLENNLESCLHSHTHSYALNFFSTSNPVGVVWLILTGN